jgi:hypothetical protein
MEIIQPKAASPETRTYQKNPTANKIVANGQVLLMVGNFIFVCRNRCLAF